MEFIIGLLGLFTLFVLLYGIYSRLDTMIFILYTAITLQSSSDLIRRLQCEDFEIDGYRKQNMRLFVSSAVGVIIGLAIRKFMT